MNKLSTERRSQIIACLVEGNSIRATCRMTNSSKGAVLKLLASLGEACLDYQDKVLRNLPCTNIQCDEIWSFCYSKEKNVPKDKKGKFGYGDCWTWTAICADTKLVPSWFVGTRDAMAAYQFMHDLKDRLAKRVQLTTDGHKAYLSAVESAFGTEIDYAMLEKIYGAAPEGREIRYSPAECVGCNVKSIMGHPDKNLVSTSFAERQNLTMRMSMRRFTRLTNAHSKKIENHEHALALYFMHYNFCRIHQTLRCTPAMEAGVSDHVWTLEEIIDLLNQTNNLKK